jgi:predicted amidohydrolase
MTGLLSCLALATLAAGASDGTKMNEKTKTIRVAVCQTFCIDGDAEGNLRRVEYALEDAARQKAVLACFPESSLLGWINPDAHKLAEPIPGPITERLAALARKHKLFICIGMDEKDGDKLYDSAILLDPQGKLLLKHRKINNLSDIKLMDPPYTDGKPADIRAIDTPLGRVGLLICADTFVEQFVKAAGEQKPDLLLVPYGWAADIKVWPCHAKELEKTVSRAAKWAGCPVVGTDCVGMISHGPWMGKTYGGQSVVVDRQGKTLGILRDRDAEVRVFEITPGRNQ